MNAGDSHGSRLLGTSAARIDWLTLAGPYIGLVLVMGLFSLLLGFYDQRRLANFLSLDNLQLVTVHASVIAAVAVGMTLVMISGGIDLSVGYVVSLVTVVTVLLYRWADGHPWLYVAPSAIAIAGGVATGCVCGLTNSLVITQLRIVPFVATLGMMGVARGLAQWWSYGQPVAFPDAVHPPAWVPWLRAIEPDPPWLLLSPAVWSVLILALLAAIVLRYQVLGRHCYAIGFNETTARYCGINVNATKCIVYTLAGFATGWAGILQTARTGSGVYNIRAGLELEVIAAVVIGGGSLTGGQGTVLGTLVGALILGILENGCSKLEWRSEVRFIIIGIIIVGVAALNSWRQRRGRLAA
jgi:ribose/xylose/arabinose/galactoside ABC-type transport system permease subunit